MFHLYEHILSIIAIYIYVPIGHRGKPGFIDRQSPLTGRRRLTSTGTGLYAWPIAYTESSLSVGAFSRHAYTRLVWLQVGRGKASNRLLF